jgi:hypothetical protein
MLLAPSVVPSPPLAAPSAALPMPPPPPRRLRRRGMLPRRCCQVPCRCCEPPSPPSWEVPAMGNARRQQAVSQAPGSRKQGTLQSMCAPKPLCHGAAPTQHPSTYANLSWCARALSLLALHYHGPQQGHAAQVWLRGLWAGHGAREGGASGSAAAAARARVAAHCPAVPCAGKQPLTQRQTELTAQVRPSSTRQHVWCGLGASDHSTRPSRNVERVQTFPKASAITTTSFSYFRLTLQQLEWLLQCPRPCLRRSRQQLTAW